MTDARPTTRTVEVLLEEDILRYFECEGKDCSTEAARLLREYVETMMAERDA